MLTYLDQFAPDLLVKVKRNPDGMADITTTKICPTNEVHEGMGTCIKVTCPECFINYLERRLECNSRKSFPAVVLFKGLCIADREGRGPIKEHSLLESPH